MNIGVNSKIVSGFSDTSGALELKDVKLVELSLRDSKILSPHGINRTALKEIVDKVSTVNCKFSVHAPHLNPGVSSVTMDLADGNLSKNVAIMRNVFQVANELNARCVVIHGGRIKKDTNSFENSAFAIREISKLAKNHSIDLFLENIHPMKENLEIGTTPAEMLDMYHKVRAENLKITLDVGHAFLSSIKYSFVFSRWFSFLSPYIYHVHMHDNLGTSDAHLPLGQGTIKFQEIFQAIKRTRAKNVVLEIKTKSRALAQESLNFLEKGLS